MNYPISTGQAAQLLATTEPKLAELVRRGHIDPAPPVMAGRRLWGREHLCQAAEHVGAVFLPDLGIVLTSTGDCDVDGAPVAEDRQEDRR